MFFSNDVIRDGLRYVCNGEMYIVLASHIPRFLGDSNEFVLYRQTGSNGKGVEVEQVFDKRVKDRVSDNARLEFVRPD